MNLSSLTSVKRINVLVTMQDIFYLRFNQLSYINLLIMLLNITYYCNIIVILNIIVFFFFFAWATELDFWAPGWVPEGLPRIFLRVQP